MTESNSSISEIGVLEVINGTPIVEIRKKIAWVIRINKTRVGDKFVGEYGAPTTVEHIAYAAKFESKKAAVEAMMEGAGAKYDKFIRDKMYVTDYIIEECVDMDGYVSHIRYA